jgi:hypothetical protein
MPRIKYVERNFSQPSRATITRANQILNEYADQGFVLTLRQLFYQFVARDFIPNTSREYDKLGSVINDARLAGLIDWEAIIDRTRNLKSVGHWAQPGEIIASAANSFRTDKWSDQDLRLEVWIEKDALVGVIEGVCESLDVPYFSCRGYTSQSEMWVAAQRLGRYIKNGQRVVVLHFGDHDPSGLDMSRDIEQRLNDFLIHDWAVATYGEYTTWCLKRNIEPGTKGSSLQWMENTNTESWAERFELRRLALTREQIDEYNPPPNPAKVTDSRFEHYRDEHGDESWELDALEPSVIAELITTAVEGERDEERWDAAVEAEAEHRRLLALASSEWPKLARQLAKKPSQ